MSDQSPNTLPPAGPTSASGVAPSVNQYSPTGVPYHVHSGVDSPQIPFLNLSDGPDSYKGFSGYTLNVNPGENALTFTAPITPGLSTATLFGDGSDGALTSSSGTTTLTRDMYYTNVTLSSTAVLAPAGYKIFVSGTLNISGSANIQRNGNAGSSGSDGHNGNIDGVGGAGGSAGTGLAAGSLPSTLAGTAGKAGGNGQASGSQGVGGNAPAANGGASTALSIGASGASNTGNKGGDGGPMQSFVGGTGASGGGGGTATLPFNTPHTLLGCYQLFDTVPSFANFTGSSASGGAGGGGGGAADTNGFGGGGGGGGGGGSNGGIIAIYANTIINSVTGGIQANGGNGATGGNGGNGTTSLGTSASGGGTGAGGSGGTGGVILIVYKTLTNTGTFIVTGGTGGSQGPTVGTGVGANGTTGILGQGGVNGAAGKIWQFQIV